MDEGYIAGLDEVKARWVLSELTSARALPHYRASSLQDLRSKVAEGATFESLSKTEIERLVDALGRARPEVLYHYLQNVTQFELQSWSKAELENAYAMSLMNEGRFVTLREYCGAPPNTKPVEADPRVVAASMAAAHQPVCPKDPITVGTHGQLRVLIDGYARGLLFLKAAKDSDRIKVYVPVG